MQEKTSVLRILNDAISIIYSAIYSAFMDE